MTNKAIHAPDCASLRVSGNPMYRCGGTYICPRCELEFGWCVGAFDDMPALCDECSNFLQFDEPVVADPTCVHRAIACRS